ncbi:hypothetical protein FisN_1Lh389 [Fistulifera solaris]|uniref:Uncharacterized protein n=1 Tax=Fistulifera solaris TaxID=1519565 RepID=A0A1Z5K3X7_FISSO|nr:hypothetical protein FisN_1Lh389 [Fistulifera solaris]|eukprot:GAX20950.1 hypothetical protein FisN_1Lh389 [Fistulifera solaris]
MSLRTILSFIAVTSAALKSQAFVLLPQRARLTASLVQDHHAVGRDWPDIDSARRLFESLFLEDSVSQQVFFSQNDEDMPVMLSSVSRRRRELEIQLLESLNDSDDAVEELMHLWIAERGDGYATTIMEMEKECSVGLLQEELVLRNMIQEQPCWAEPVIRLATLLFYKGRTEESYELAMHALCLKPWHIEVPQLLVMLALREQNMAKAICWARRGIPALSRTNRRRKEWVALSLEQAREQFNNAERQQEEYCQTVKSHEWMNKNTEPHIWE